MEADAALLQQVAGLLRTKNQSRKADSFSFVFAVVHSPLLSKAVTEQIHQILRTSTAVQTYAASDGHVSAWSFTLLGQKAVSLRFLKATTFLHSVLTRKKEPAKSVFFSIFRQLQKRCFSFTVMGRRACACRTAVFMLSCTEKRGAGLEWRRSL